MKLLCPGALFASLCLAPLCLAPVLSAQKAVAPEQEAARGAKPPPLAAGESDDPTRIILDVTRVNLLFTVTDKKGRFVTDLGRDDFEVVENKKPQTIQPFTAAPDLQV